MLVLKNPIEDGGIGEDDEAEAPGPAAELVLHDDGLKDLAVVPKVLLQPLLGGLPRNPPDEELALIGVHRR